MKSVWECMYAGLIRAEFIILWEWVCYWDRNFQVMQEIHEVLGWTAAQCDHSSVQLNGRLNVKVCLRPWASLFHFVVVIMMLMVLFQSGLACMLKCPWSQIHLLGLRVKWGGKRIWHPSRISSRKTDSLPPQEQHLQGDLDRLRNYVNVYSSKQPDSAIRGESISDWMPSFFTDLL